MVADWGTKDEAIGKLLDRLQGSRQLPFLAIFPAGRPQDIITFSGLYSRKQLLKSLEKAGPSTSRGDSTQRAPDPSLIISKLP